MGLASLSWIFQPSAAGDSRFSDSPYLRVVGIMTTPDAHMQTAEETVVQEIEEGCRNISLEAEEEVGIDLPDETENQSANIDLQHAMVDRFLTDKHIKFDYMQQVLASVWRPVMGMRIKEIRPNLYIFQFFHEKDINRVLDRGPWGFENYTLICRRLGAEDVPEQVSLYFLDIWAQIYGLPCGYMSERIASLIGDHLGSFISNDPSNFLGGWINFLRIRVSIDVRLPLKRKMKLKKKDGSCFWVTFKYERLHTFCYYCGILGHSLQFCRKLYRVEMDLVELPYGAWLRENLRQPDKLMGSRWILEESRTDVNEAGASEELEDGSNGVVGGQGDSEPNPRPEKADSMDPQEDDTPTYEFKRRRASDCDGEVRSNQRHMNYGTNLGHPASPARQARPNQ